MRTVRLFGWLQVIQRGLPNVLNCDRLRPVRSFGWGGMTIAIGLIQTLVGADLGLFAGLRGGLSRTKTNEVTPAAWTTVLLSAEGDQNVLRETDFIIAARPRAKFQPQAAGALGIPQLPEQPNTNRKPVCTPSAAKRMDAHYPAQPLRPVGVPGPPDLFTTAVCALQAGYVHLPTASAFPCKAAYST
jgi:hypothetical protein